MMKKIQYHKYGGPELIRLEEVEPPLPGKGQVLVRVRAAAANPMDWKVRDGDTRMMTGRRFPRGLGHDFAGTVARTGEGVTRFEAGDEVLGAMSLKDSGAFAEMVVADENLIVAKPARLSFEEAAALPTVGVTALQSVIDKGGLRAGQSVFVNGCLGGVGRAAAQIALMHGVSVAGSCRDSAAADAKALGIAPVVGFSFDPARLKGQFDLVIDTAGTLSLKDARTLLAPHGRIVDLNGSPAKMARSVVSRDFKPLIAKYTPEALKTVADAATDGKLAVPVARTVPLTQAIGALTELERTRTPKGGKVVIVMQGAGG
jgi:NADPH:quinone reductase-like Zn-dependent oxidoreductase